VGWSTITIRAPVAAAATAAEAATEAAATFATVAKVSSAPEAAATLTATEAAAEASSEAAAEAAGAHGSRRHGLGVTPAAQASAKAARFPALDGPAPLDVYLDTSIPDTNAITSI
jgi:hypothetical protein